MENVLVCQEDLCLQSICQFVEVEYNQIFYLAYIRSYTCKCTHLQVYMCISIHMEIQMSAQRMFSHFYRGHVCASLHPCIQTPEVSSLLYGGISCKVLLGKMKLFQVVCPR